MLVTHPSRAAVPSRALTISGVSLTVGPEIIAEEIKFSGHYLILLKTGLKNSNFPFIDRAMLRC